MKEFNACLKDIETSCDLDDRVMEDKEEENENNEFSVRRLGRKKGKGGKGKGGNSSTNTGNENHGHGHGSGKGKGGPVVVPSVRIVKIKNTQ